MGIPPYEDKNQKYSVRIKSNNWTDKALKELEIPEDDPQDFQQVLKKLRTYRKLPIEKIATTSFIISPKFELFEDGILIKTL